jgi:hypothetical protein
MRAFNMRPRLSGTFAQRAGVGESMALCLIKLSTKPGIAHSGPFWLKA